MPASVATTGGQNLEKLLMFPLEKAQAAGPDIIFPNVQKFLSLYLAYSLRFFPLGNPRKVFKQVAQAELFVFLNF